MNLITVHTLTALPWHNLNRDETGAPKQVLEGGVVRARLSSQALKRAARERFEVTAERKTVRTKRAASLVTEKMSAAKRRTLETRINALTSGDDKGKDTAIWLSDAELSALAAGKAPEDGTTDSLSIAAFGRMFANQQNASTHAAVSVGHAVTTHEATFEMDWFTALEETASRRGEAAQLGYTMATTGVYYRSFTIDIRQLHHNYRGTLDAAEVSDLVNALTFALPNGRGTNSAAHTLPAFIFAEEQAHRVAYSFHTPVTASPLLEASIERLRDEAARARQFSPALFGDSMTSGTCADKVISADEYTQWVVERVMR